MLANVRNNSNLFLESDKSVHCPSIYHLDLDIHIDTHKDSSSSWFFFNFFIFARLVVFSLLFLIMIQTIGGLNLWMVKGWVMVVVKVIMVMMVEVNCSKNSLFFFWFLDGDSNCKFSVNQSPNPLILGLEILDLDFGLDNYKVLMLVGQDSVCVWCCVWCVQQCSA